MQEVQVSRRNASLKRRQRILDAECTRVLSGLFPPPLPTKWVTDGSYKLVCARRWKFKSEHINIKEARVSLMQLRHIARSVRNFRCRCSVLCDSQVTIGAFEKSRSSRSKALMALCRRGLAYRVGCRLQLRFRYVESERNALDAPSRIFNPKCDEKNTSISPALPGIAADAGGPRKDIPSRVSAFSCSRISTYAVFVHFGDVLPAA